MRKSSLLVLGAASLLLAWLAFTGCAGVVRGLACNAEPYSWDPGKEQCRDRNGNDAPSACCDKG